MQRDKATAIIIVVMIAFSLLFKNYLQFKLIEKPMITYLKKKDILSALEIAFPEKKINVKDIDEASAESVSINVPEINKSQLMHIVRATNRTEVDIKLKRSGTGISITFE